MVYEKKLKICSVLRVLFLVTPKGDKDITIISKKVHRNKRRTVKGTLINQRMKNVVELVIWEISIRRLTSWLCQWSSYQI